MKRSWRNTLAWTLAVWLIGPGLTQPASAQENDALRASVTTLFGPTGLITVPNAYAIAHKRGLVGTHFGPDKSVTADYGLINGVEVGTSWQDSGNDLFFNAKINIVPSNFKGFELGLGVIDIADFQKRTFYGIASAEIGVPSAADINKNFVALRVHGGFGSGLYKEDFIGGLELLFNRKLSIIGEYNGNEVNAGVRYVHDEALRLQAGVQRHGLFFTACYAFNP